MWAQGDRRGWRVGKTKNASCSELGDEKASCGEPRRFPGFDAPMCQWLPGPWISHGLRESTRPAKPFSSPPPRDLLPALPNWQRVVPTHHLSALCAQNIHEEREGIT